MEHTIGNLKEFFPKNKLLHLPYQRVDLCPHCGKNIVPVNLGHAPYYHDIHVFLIIVSQCPSCKNLLAAAYDIILGVECNRWAVYPQYCSGYGDDVIEKMSPRFVDMYKQSLHAKDDGLLDLAFIGFRSALEILIKDYAINVLKLPKNKVAKKSLFKAIPEYLQDDSLKIPSDVVRILGNDHTHYVREHTDVDFDTVQEYMNILLRSLRDKLMIINPPVSR